MKSFKEKTIQRIRYCNKDCEDTVALHYTQAYTDTGDPIELYIVCLTWGNDYRIYRKYNRREADECFEQIKAAMALDDRWIMEN